jgi:hypothetical protein
MLLSSRRHVSCPPRRALKIAAATRTQSPASPGAPPYSYPLARQSPWLHGAQSRASARATGQERASRPAPYSSGAGLAPINRRARRLCRDEAAGDRRCSRLSRGQHVSNAAGGAEQDERDNDATCDREGAASARAPGARLWRRRLERGHRSRRPNPRGAAVLGVGRGHENPRLVTDRIS